MHAAKCTLVLCRCNHLLTCSPAHPVALRAFATSSRGRQISAVAPDRETPRGGRISYTAGGRPSQPHRASYDGKAQWQDREAPPRTYRDSGRSGQQSQDPQHTYTRPGQEREAERQDQQPYSRPEGGRSRPPYGQHRDRNSQSRPSYPSRSSFNNPRPSYGQQRQSDSYSQQQRYEGYDDRPRAPSIVLEGEAVYGISAISAALAANRRTLHKVYVQAGLDTVKRKDGGALSRAISAANQADVPIATVSKHDLNTLVDNRPHQGLVLDCSPLPWVPMDVLPPPEASSTTSRLPVWLALDEVTDPQNLGSLVRSAYFLGAAGVLCCAKNSAPLSPAVAKASSGALEMLPLHSCSNLMRTLQAAGDAGWLVLGADAAPEAESLSSYTLDKPAVLVMGSEGRGLRTLVRRCCHGLLRVDTPSEGVLPGLDSLNVGVAGGVLLHRLLLSQQQHSPAAATEQAAGL